MKWFTKRRLLLLFLIIAGAIFLYNPQKNKTRIYSGEEDYLKFRAEGLSFREAVSSGIKYLRKYLNKRTYAPDSIVEFFQRQAEKNRSMLNFPGEKEILSVAFLGDIMWLRNGWDKFLSREVKSYLEKFDLVAGNLETPIDTQKKIPSLFPDYQSYNSSPDLIYSFRKENNESILSILSLANNHALDMGINGLNRTIGFLQKSGIRTNGAYTNEFPDKDWLIIEKNGIKIGFYSATWGLNDPGSDLLKEVKINVIPGIAPPGKENIDLSGLINILRQMKKENVDLKILQLHWGYEYELYPDAEIMKIGRKLAANGADLIIGGHPHVIQPDEICFINGYQKNQKPLIDVSTDYCLLSDSSVIPRKSLIVYSLGNFATAMFTPLCRLGAIQSVKLFRNMQTGLIDWTFPETRFVYNTPSDPDNSCRKLLLWDDYIKRLELISPSQAAKIKKNAAVIFNFY